MDIFHPHTPHLVSHAALINARYTVTDAGIANAPKLFPDWLCVPKCITYKLCVLVYNCLHGTAPRYLQDIIQPVAEVTSRRRLRSASSSTLMVPATRRSSLGDRAFVVAGPCAWISLPEFVTDCSSLLTFKKYLKTYLFSLSF